MIPPLLLTPRVDFWHDASLYEFLGKRVHAFMRRAGTKTPGVLAIAQNSTNTHFYISSVTPEILQLVCRTFARRFDKAGRIRVAVLAFPANRCLIDSCGSMLDTSFRSAAPSLVQSVQFSPLQWSMACTEILHLRDEHMAMCYQRYQVTQEVYADLCAERDELKSALADELMRGESSARMLQRELHRRASHRAESKRKSNEVAAALSERDAARAVARQTAQALRQLAKEHRNLKTAVASALARFQVQTVEVAKLMQLLKVALQCKHYFTVDRFSSTHFREHISHTERGESVPVSVLSEFPRIRLLCDGDKTTIGAACALLDLCVCDGLVYLDSNK